jgi:hypothetical protein
VGLVAELMRELGLPACQPRACKRTTIAGEAAVSSPDRLERDFEAPAPGQRLVGDITSWVYRRAVAVRGGRIETRPTGIRPAPGSPRHPQRRAAQPSEQADGQALVLLAKQHWLRRKPCLEYPR